MTELQKAKDELIEFKNSIYGLRYIIEKLPRSPSTQPDTYDLMNEILQLIGFIDCMIKFDIQLLPNELFP